MNDSKSEACFQQLVVTEYFNVAMSNKENWILVVSNVSYVVSDFSVETKEYHGQHEEFLQFLLYLCLLV